MTKVTKLNMASDQRLCSHLLWRARNPQLLIQGHRSSLSDLTHHQRQLLVAQAGQPIRRSGCG